MKYNEDRYKPSWFLRSGHINTLYPYLVRPQIQLDFTRERFELSDGDFIDIDWIKNDSKKLVVLCHGLEGSTESKYMRYLSVHCAESNYNVCAINYRGCSGEINRTKRIYHSGATEDILEVLEKYEDEYDEIVLIGFSLGGNIVLKLVGEAGDSISSKIVGVVAISVPCDLESGSYQLMRTQNLVYTNRFLRTLKKKAKLKLEQFPDLFNLEDVLASKNVFEFDDRFTGPVHGFEGAIDYYRKCRSIQFLHNIKVPTLIINAIDDTFLSDECYPIKEADENKLIQLIISRFGGHVGFTIYGQDKYWHELKIEAFLEDQFSS